jgi:anti-sigma factor RsiW
MHPEWIDKLSDYLDDELTPVELDAVDAHLAECPDCAQTLDELRRVAEHARSLRPLAPANDLWAGVAGRLAREGARTAARRPRLVSFTMPQLAAAAVLIAALSGAAAFVGGRFEARRDSRPPTAASQPASAAQAAGAAGEVVSVGFADAQYDAAVADLEHALKSGRGKLDQSTIAALEHSLQTIDQAIDQAREALSADPANTYLSGYLVETRRRKLDLLRRAAALTETD